MLAAALLSGCGAKNIPSANENVQTETTAESTAVSVTESESVTEKTEVLSDELFTESKDEYYIAVGKDGAFKELSQEETDKMQAAMFFDVIMADDTYFGDLSGEEKRQMLMETFEISEEDLSAADDYSCIFTLLQSGDSEEDHGRTVFEFVLKRAEENGQQLMGTADNPVSVTVYYYISDGIIQVNAAAFDGSEEFDIAEGEYITSDGKDVATIGGRPVPADTKSIYISAYDETRAAFIDNGASENYEVKIFDYDTEEGNEGLNIDIAELAKQFPKLEKLYLSAYVTPVNMQAFSEFEPLKEVQLDVQGYEELSMLSGLKTQRLIISGVECPADALAGLDVKELCIECTPSEGVLESIYRLENVSELTINRYGDEDPVLSGIENLSGLKKLDISADSGCVLDAGPLAKLRNVEDLRIMADSTRNLDKIAEMKSVKKLLLHSMDEEDLSFLSEMTGLEELSLMYVNSSFGPSLQYLKNVRSFSVSDTTDGADISRIFQLENVEELMLMGENFSTRGISSLEKLKTLRIMLCRYSDLSGLKKCSSLENLLIYNCDTPEFDAEDIKGMTQLKTLSFNCSEIYNYKALRTLTGLKDMKLYFCDLSDDEIMELKRALPDCSIKTDKE